MLLRVDKCLILMFDFVVFDDFHNLFGNRRKAQCLTVEPPSMPMQNLKF